MNNINNNSEYVNKIIQLFLEKPQIQYTYQDFVIQEFITITQKRYYNTFFRTLKEQSENIIIHCPFMLPKKYASMTTENKTEKPAEEQQKLAKTALDLMNQHTDDPPIERKKTTNIDNKNKITELAQNQEEEPKEENNLLKLPSQAVKTRRNKSETNPALQSSCKEGFVSSETMVKTISQHLKNRPLYIKKDVTGKITPLRSRQKMTKIYNQEQQQETRDKIAYLIRNKKVCYFLTITNNASQEEKDLVKIWQHFSDDVSKTLKELTRSYNINYVCVLESTENGYPHAHILIGTNDYLEQFHKDQPKGKTVTHGKLYEKLKEEYPNSLISLKIAYNLGLIKYMTKTLDPKIEEVVKEAEKNNYKTTKDERKMLLSNLLSTQANVRTIRYSLEIGKAIKQSEEELEKKDNELLEYSARNNIHTIQADGALLRWYNKNYKQCLQQTMAFYTKEEINELENLDNEQVAQKIAEKTAKLNALGFCKNTDCFLIYYYIKLRKRVEDYNKENPSLFIKYTY